MAVCRPVIPLMADPMSQCSVKRLIAFVKSSASTAQLSQIQHQNSTRNKVRVATTKGGTTTSLAGTVGNKGVVMAMRVGVMMRREVTKMRMRARAMIKNTTTRD